MNSVSSVSVIRPRATEPPSLARREAAWLDAVSELQEPPTRLTMVLLKRSEYRAALEGLLEFRRSALVQLDEPRLNAPLSNLPALYEAWGTLHVIAAVLQIGTERGYWVQSERLTSRRSGDVWIQVLRDGQTAVLLSHPRPDTTVRVIPQRTYSLGGKPLASATFQQRPDVAIEITRAEPEVWIFDPKYKLDSEQVGEEANANRRR
jgi:hypothetical protein